MINVTAEASDATAENFGVWVNATSIPKLSGVQATASGDGQNVTNAGIYASFCTPAIQWATVKASGASADNYGILSENSGPTIIGTAAYVESGAQAYGIYLGAGSAMMSATSVFASGSDSNCGIAISGASATLHHVSASATGGIDNIGIDIQSGSPKFSYVTTVAKDGTGEDYGFRHSATADVTADVTADHCVFRGDDVAVYYDGSGDLFIGSAKIQGMVEDADSGTLKCVLCYDNSYNELDSDCQ